MTVAEERFFKPRFPASTHGMYAFRANGEILGRGGGYNAGAVEKMLRRALTRFRTTPDATVVIDDGPGGEGSVRKPPDGGLVLYVTWKVVGGYERPESSSTTGHGKYDSCFRNAVGSDRLWVRRDETKALAKGEFPESLKRRMARFHLTYAFSGKVKASDLEFSIHEGGLSGRCRTEGSEPIADLEGKIEAQHGKITRFDLLVKGAGERVADCGFSAGLTIVPKATTVQVAMLFSLADLRRDLARVPPHRIKSASYFK